MQSKCLKCTYSTFSLNLFLLVYDLENVDIFEMALSKHYQYGISTLAFRNCEDHMLMRLSVLNNRLKYALLKWVSCISSSRVIEFLGIII